jgi:hypothetical protein
MTLRDTGEAITRATVRRQVRRNVKSDKVELVNGSSIRALSHRSGVTHQRKIRT